MKNQKQSTHRHIQGDKMEETIIQKTRYALNFAMEQYLKNNPHYSLFVSESQKEKIVNLALSVFLCRWLENDSAATQTLRSFSLDKYYFESSKNKYKILSGNDKTHTNSYYAALRRAEIRYRHMMGTRVQQAESEGITVLPENAPVPEGVEHSFVQLRFLDLLVNKKLELFTLLTYRKEVLSVTNEKDSNRSLIIAYRDYDNIFKEIKNMSERNPREYVVSCVQIQKFESTFRFNFIAKLAKALLDNGLDTESKKLEYIAYYLGRYCSNEHPIAEPYDILNYDYIIENVLFENEEEAKRQYVIRHILQIILTVVCKLAPVESLPHWNNDTYLEAADFFKNNYPIAESYRGVDLTDESTIQNSLLIYIIELAKKLPNLDDFRTNMQILNHNKIKHN